MKIELALVLSLSTVASAFVTPRPIIITPGVSSSPLTSATTSTEGRQSTTATTTTQLFVEANGASSRKVLVLGGDGFCGWPTSLYLSDQGHDVVIVDNLSRRNIDIELGCDSLTPIQSPEVRLDTKGGLGHWISRVFLQRGSWLDQP